MAEQLDPPPVGTIVPSTFDPAIVTAAFFASLCGCLLTVEILHRRGTALGSWRSWLETIACATSMGLVGIWCMHFIGNRAIILGDGNRSTQLMYNPGWTTFSVFLPILGLSAAFAVAEWTFNSLMLHRCAIAFTGVLAGLSVIGMHYIGNLGVLNYTLHYSTQFFVASFIIAIGACLAVLALFYRWREQWISSWWKRLICAVMLAAGVSAMHFTASTSCTYVVKAYDHRSRYISRDVQVTIAGALCGATTLAVLGFLLSYRYRTTIYQRRSKKIMLACAMFDPDGRLLVTNDGTFPTREITDQYNHRTFNEDFDTTHPAFQWVFRVTHNWAGINELLPGMKSHISGYRGEVSNTSWTQSSIPVYDSDTYSDYSVIFRELFCTAAASLAEDVQMPIGKLGVLYDKIIETGTLRAQKPCLDELEAGLDEKGTGRGQLMFVTRQISKEEAIRLLNTEKGYRFADFNQVGRSLAYCLRISAASLKCHTEGLHCYAEQLQSPGKSGTWLSLFALVPSPGRKGFDVVVKRKDSKQLPDAILSNTKLEPWQAKLLLSLNDLTMSSCLHALGNTQLPSEGQKLDRERQFSVDVQRAITDLVKALPSDWLKNARFSAKPLTANYSCAGCPDAEITLYSFYVIIDMHAWVEGLHVDRIPLSFFNVRQRCYPSSPDHAVLTRDIHQEFAPMLARRSYHVPGPRQFRRTHTAHSSRSSARTFDQPQSIYSSDKVDAVESSVELPTKPELVHRRLSRGGDVAWGGILVNSETVVKNDTKEDVLVSSSEVTELMGVNVAVSTVKPAWTFADELFSITKARFLHTSS